MIPFLHRFPNRIRGRTVQIFAFFSIFCLYLRFEVQPNLIYHGGGVITNFPVFYKGWVFFNEIFWRPGGPTEYLAAFLSQLLYCSWAGAIMLTIHAWLVYVFTAYFLRIIGLARLRIISFIGPILLLITYNKYTWHFETTLAFLFALVFLCIYVALAGKNNTIRMLLFLSICLLLYFISAGAYLFFAVVAVIYEIFFGHRWFFGLLYGVFAAFVGYVLGVLVFNISLTDVYSKLLPFYHKIIEYPDRRRMIEAVYVLYLFLPLLVIVFGLWLLLSRSKLFLHYIKGGGKVKSGGVESGGQRGAPYRQKWIICFESLFLFVIGSGAVVYFFDGAQKAVFEVDYYLGNGEWKKVIETGRHYQSNDHISHALNRALYHLGLLPSDMFCYKQRLSCLMLTSREEMFTPWNQFDTLYDLGAVNQCESALGDSMDVYGERPQILKKMAIVRIAKKDVDTARVYLGALGKTLFYSGWAKDFLQRVEADPNMPTDMEVQRLRELMPQKDKSLITFSVEKTFLDLLERNSKNRMAFEYLMAFYMLRKDLNKFVQNLSRLDDFDYPQIPRHYEEAVITYKYVTNKTPDLKGRGVSEKSQQRFREFLQMAERYVDKPKVCFEELSKYYSDTYYFYYVYGVSGVKNE